MYLVIGSTGLLGGEICRRLAVEGKQVRALVRATSDPAKIENLKNLGIEVVQGDLKDRSSLAGACQDVTTVISTASSTLSRQSGDTIWTVDLEGHNNLIDAVLEAGGAQFIYISFRTRENPSLQYPLKKAKRSIEQRLMDSGLDYTIIQASYFMEVWLSPALGFDFENEKVQIYGQGQNPISWISYLDVAQFVLACFDHSAAKKAILELGGPEALTPMEAVKIFEVAKGSNFSVEYVPEYALLDQKNAAADDLQETFAGLMLQYANGDPMDMTETLHTFSLKFTSVEDYARQVLPAMQRVD